MTLQRRLSFCCLAFGLFFNASAQLKIAKKPDSLFGTYYEQQLSLYKLLPKERGQVVFLGNSIADGGEWQELFPGEQVINRGISGDITAGIINRLNEATDRKPKSVFLMIGTNDLARNVAEKEIFDNILFIVDYILQESPATTVFLQSILPVNGRSFSKFKSHYVNTQRILSLNKKLEDSADAHHYSYIDLHEEFAGSDNLLDPAYTNDGLHLNGKGYRLWASLLYPYFYGGRQIDNIIPKPISLIEKKGMFWLDEGVTIIDNSNSLQNERAFLDRALVGKKVDQTEKAERIITIQLQPIPYKQNKNESYRLEVSESKVTITANHAHGIFNGIQTLLQLLANTNGIPACEISDEPAFAWRAFMTDVGRNYQGMKMLKEMIDKMAFYKLNVFHFHPTENVAWRLPSAKYPQLHAPGNRTRNPGMYYTVEEIKELIEYCRQRHIEFVPEIDMPGHSDAFTRAFGFNMQSDSGVVRVKELVNEYIDTFKPKYLHIGGDEVKITNKNLIPEVIKMVEARGVKVIGWEPGANFTNSVLRQLWMDDNGFVKNPDKLQFIDSRHLYINHMDPLEAVTTLFYRKIGTVTKGSETMWGATLCLWPDRNVRAEEDILTMNPVYPSIATFAERTWNGGGYDGWAANIDDKGEAAKKDFTNFENRLLTHKKLYFKNIPFPYVRQSKLQWQLFGPYDNKGNVGEIFIPEQNKLAASIKPYKTVTGGTIVLRHWWNDLIKGPLTDAKENNTWYASTSIEAKDSGYYPFWIGFYNISRSQATNTPPKGEWNNMGAKVWVNGEEIPAPQWRRGGEKGDLEIPLMDEGYEYRPPTMIHLKKGPNKVLLKLPIKSFDGPNWNNPVKYQFTFVPVE